MALNNIVISQNTKQSPIVDDKVIEGIFSKTCNLPSSPTRHDDRITGTRFDMYKVLKHCREFPQVTVKCFSHPFAEGNLEITVYQDTITKIEGLLKEKTKRNWMSRN